MFSRSIDSNDAYCYYITWHEESLGILGMDMVEESEWFSASFRRGYRYRLSRSILMRSNQKKGRMEKYCKRGGVETESWLVNDTLSILIYKSMEDVWHFCLHKIHTDGHNQHKYKVLTHLSVFDTGEKRFFKKDCSLFTFCNFSSDYRIKKWAK